MRWISTRTIEATREVVFKVVADPEEFQKAIVGGSAVEFLTDARSGVGTRFRATRIMKGRASTFRQLVTEFVPGERVRMLNVTHGTEWDSVFDLRPEGPSTVLTLTMDSKSPRLFPRIMIRLFSRMVRKALDQDLESVKRYCEAGGNPGHEVRPN